MKELISFFEEDTKRVFLKGIALILREEGGEESKERGEVERRGWREE